MDSDIYLRLTDAERAAVLRCQRGIQSRDREKRRREMRKYRTFLDYLERMERITPEQRLRLETYRIEGRHV